MKKMKRVLRGAISALLVLSMLLSTSIAIFAAESEDTAENKDTIDVVMLTKNVSSGKKIKSTDVEIKTFKNVNIPDNVISDSKAVVGKYAKTNLYAGEYVYAEQLSAKSVAANNSHLLNQAISRSEAGFVNVTDYFDASSGEDVTTLIQKLIDANTKRTIYFPDGEYLITRPILTDGGAATTVSLLLSDGAVIKADPELWRAESSDVTAMICLGKKDRSLSTNNDVVSVGSYYSIQGGTIDGSGVAEGICLGGGRETLVKNVLIKNTKIGIDVAEGTNNVSSDMDVDDVTIIGNGKKGSIGMNIIGYDNTFTNVRIYGCEIGVELASGGNAFRDIRVYNTSGEFAYANTRGFVETTDSNNFYYHCYTEDCANGFVLCGYSNIIDSCTSRWTKAQGDQKMFVIVKGFNSCASACRIMFFNSSTTNHVVSFSGHGGSGAVEAPIIKASLSDTGDALNSIKRGSVVTLGG